MSMRVSEIVSSRIGNAISNINTWGGVFYNVKDPSYGAKGDGETDDTAAILKAINAAKEAGGGIVIFPSGTYYMSSDLIITDGEKIIIQGVGKSTVLMKMIFGVAYLLITLNLTQYSEYGSTDNRLTPTYPQSYFDTTIKQRVDWDGYRWVKCDGNPGYDYPISNNNIYSASATYTPTTISSGSSMTAQNGVDMSKDFIMYFNVKLADTDDFFNVVFSNLGTTKLRIAFGYDWTTSTTDGVSISVRDEVNLTTAKLGVQDLQTDFVEVIIWYDHKWQYFNIFINDELLNSWKPNAGGVNPLEDINRVVSTSGNSTTLVTFNYYYMGIPLMAAIGDSITAGATGYAPNPDHYPGIDNYNSSYPKYISDAMKASGIRNYFVINKGVNGETSDQIKARFSTDILSLTPKYVLIHGGINDHDTHATVETTIQNKRDMAEAAISAGVEPFIISVLPTAINAPGHAHQYAIDLQAVEKSYGYEGYKFINIFDAIEDPNNPGTALSSLLVDTVHPNVEGYKIIGDLISSYYDM